MNGTALPLLDDDGKQQQRPDARDRDRRRALDHRFHVVLRIARWVPKMPATIDCMAMIIGP